MRKLSRLLAALALPVLAGAGRADDDAIRLAPADANVTRVNQQLADDIALQMKKSGRLTNYNINISTEGGVVTLAGRVASAQQRAEALNIARTHAGVVAVDDKLSGGQDASLVAVNFVQPPANTTAPPPPGFVPPGYNALPTRPPATGPDGKPVPEPFPQNAFPGGLAPYSDTPVIPPYAWPAYTPYNNFASMAYQTQYPSGSWPFIGPPHPYPMIPSGWRSVNLRWRRGYWWLKFNAF
jgi:hypothetical protein